MFRLKFLVYISVLFIVLTLSLSGVSYAGHCSGGHDKKSDSCSEKSYGEKASSCSEKSNDDRSET